ncbi:hypothetical protein FRC20_003749 [Serendipita sp. 405]|nr:hypothetical protein FRC20_003749 [Serendipita sp. 405]
MSNDPHNPTGPGRAPSSSQQTEQLPPRSSTVIVSEPLLDHQRDVISPTPIRSLHEELLSIRPLGTEFTYLLAAFDGRLAEDRNADEVREKMGIFKGHLRHSLIDIGDALASARVYYSHSESDSFGDESLSSSPIMTAKLMRNLTKREFREGMFEHAQAAASSLEFAIETLRREVIPRISRMQQRIESYVEGYMTRHHMLEQRDRSWVQTIFVNIYWSGVDSKSLKWDVAKVEDLPSKWNSVGTLLRRLFSFVEHMHLHMMQLTEITQRSLTSLGISTRRDLRRLYSDRVACSGLLMAMDDAFLMMEQDLLSNVG